MSLGEELKELEPGYLFCGCRGSLRLSARIGYFRPVFRLKLLCFEIDSNSLRLSILSAGLGVCSYRQSLKCMAILSYFLILSANSIFIYL